MFVAMLLAVVADTNSSTPAQRLSEMVALYREVCLETFPNDTAIEAMMKTRDARELSADEVKVTMGGDPARAWELKGGAATVWVEFPPFHACSVRWNTPRLSDLREYRAVADRYQGARGGFTPMESVEGDQGAIHIHMAGERRSLANQATESLLVIEQTINDPNRREAGETGAVLRFVHQFTQPPTSGAR